MIAKTGTNIILHPNGTIEYTTRDRENSGYLFIHQSANRNWPAGDHNRAGIVRYEDYWIAGEFVPSFGDNYWVGNRTNFNLIHSYHSVFVQFIPRPSGKGWFGFDRDEGAWGNSRELVMGVPNIPFNSGDTLRYMARSARESILSDGLEGMTFWVRNITQDTLVFRQESTWVDSTDFDNRQLRYLYLGSGSHGNSYDDPSRPKENFWGTITETIYGQSRLTDQESFEWLFGREMPDTINFQQTSAVMNREVMIPLYQWLVDDSSTGTVNFSGFSTKWAGPGIIHNVLLSQDTSGAGINHKVRYAALEDEVSPEDRKARYFSFVVNPLSQNQFHLYLSASDRFGNHYTFDFSPSYEKLAYDGLQVLWPLASQSHPMRSYFDFDLVALLPPSSDKPNIDYLSIETIAATGSFILADLVISKNLSVQPIVIDTSSTTITGPLSAYPNPSQSGATIRYKIAEIDQPTITIYNLLGQVVFRENLGILPAGEHYFHWSGRNRAGSRVPSGVYIVSIETSNKIMSFKLSLIKEIR